MSGINAPHKEKNPMLNFIGWLIVGLIAGALARLIMPGRDPMGVIATIVLGIVGSANGKLAAGCRAKELLKTSIVPLAKSAA